MTARKRRETTTVLHAGDDLRITMTTSHAGYAITITQPPAGITVTGHGSSRIAARKDAREKFREAFGAWKVRRLIRRYARDAEDELTLLMTCGLLPYQAKPETGFVPGGRVSAKEKTAAAGGAA